MPRDVVVHFRVVGNKERGCAIGPLEPIREQLKPCVVSVQLQSLARFRELENKAVRLERRRVQIGRNIEEAWDRASGDGLQGEAIGAGSEKNIIWFHFIQ